MGLIIYYITMVSISEFFMYNSVLSQDNSEINQEPAFYTAAVFEHSIRGDYMKDKPIDFIKNNLLFYKNAAKEAKSQGADIIIFPEYGIIPWLNRENIKTYLELIPDPKKYLSNPCNNPVEFNNRTILLTLSCIAKNNSIAVVANMGDIQPCNKLNNRHCPDDGVFHFNANVAFDKNGFIIAKYHKEHLFLEPGMNFPQETQNPIFSTEFGTFAMYICFDVAYKSITNTAKNTVVDAILLPNLWFDFKPFMSSVQFWEAWSIGNNVPFFAVNGQLNFDANVGSGIFLGQQGSLVYTYNPDGLSKLLVSRVPKRNKMSSFFNNTLANITIITENDTQHYDIHNDGKSFFEVCTRKQINTSNFTNRYRCSEENTSEYIFLKLNETSGSHEICNNGMCCSLIYSANRMDEDFYFGVFNGSTKADNYSWCTENCFLARCDSYNNSICSTFPVVSHTIFNKIKIKANFTTSSIYPSILKNNGRLSTFRERSFTVTGQLPSLHGQLTYQSNSEIPLTFAGMNGRCFDRDPSFVEQNTIL